MELRDAKAQVLVLALVCFCCPGLFNALSSIASGLAEPSVAYAGNAVVCASFASSSLLASSLLARAAIGVRSALVLGTLGYVVYSCSLSSLNREGAPSRLVLRLFYAACAALGLSAGFLWAAQGLMVMSYATKQTQGQLLSRFWAIFNLGAVVGGLASFLANVNGAEGAPNRSSPAMYAVFLALMCAGSVLAGCCILPPDQVVKADGTSVHAAGLADTAAASTETGAASQILRGGRVGGHSLVAGRIAAVACLLPLFAYSNWFYTYHSLFNVSMFNARTSGLSCACYWLAQMAAASVSGASLDRHVKRLDAASQDLGSEQSDSTDAGAAKGESIHLHHHHVRIIATRSLSQLAVLANGMWAIGWYFQASTPRLAYGSLERLDVVADFQAYIPPFLLYMLYGWHDAQCQVWIYWYLGSMVDRDPAFCARLTGIYKCVQAVSASASWFLGATEVDALIQLEINWGLCNVALVGAWLSIGALARVLVAAKRQQADAIGELLPLVSQIDR